jgi:oligopeptide/dipeptide ABC transporter ATP-binding protein
MSSELLQVDDVTVAMAGAAKVELVRQVSLAVGEGEIVGVLGESGSGKTTLCRAVAGVLADGLRVESGEISLLSQPVGASSGGRVGMIFQEPLAALNPVMRIGDQLLEAIRARGGVSKDEARRRAVELLDWVGIREPTSRMRDYPHQFSGGQRQRILIAIVVALEPKVLVADEPTSALDVRTQLQILELLERIVAERGMAMVLVTHDFGVIKRLCSRVLVMYGGSVVESGSTEEVLRHPRHPYTLALMEAIPSLIGEASRLVSIPGTPLHPADAIPGCRFHPRCRYATEQCSEVVPVLVEARPSHLSACMRIDAIWPEQPT